MRLGIYVSLPSVCKGSTDPVRRIEANAYTERWTVLCPGGLKGGTITVEGLEATFTDALVRIGYADGTSEVARLKPDKTSVRIAGPQTTFQVARTYFRLGVEHILGGVDHLLFVFALMLLIADRWTLLKTITAFTVAHSITLAGSSLGYMSLPQPPVEAVIALSIAFVARELIKAKPNERRLSQEYPWVIAFCFGLLHGFGFAGALRAIGLPQTDVPLALVTFNLGVEVGQLAFVCAMSLLLVLLRSLGIGRTKAMPTFAAYGIGAMATIWFIERIASFSPL
jgi:hydrogenase/urease accessory protein HupE